MTSAREGDRTPPKQQDIASAERQLRETFLSPSLASADARAQFEAHLDGCAQCREQPFNLCVIGAPLLQRAATEEFDALAKSRTDDRRDNDRHRARPL